MVATEVLGSDTRNGFPPVSLIVCSRNRPHLLGETVESILAGTAVPAELIIIDQSDVPHPALARLTTEGPCMIRYVWTRSVGLSRANNSGVATASHDILVFTHDDVRVAATWLGTLVRSLSESGPRSVVTGQVPPAQERPGGFQEAIKVDQAPAVYEGRVAQDVLIPLNMAMYRSALDEVGGFDERLGPGAPFHAAEDNDLGFRLLEASYRIVYVPEAIVYHRAWRAPRDFLPLRWRYAVGQGAFYAKHASLRDRHIVSRAWTDIARYVARAPLRVRTRDWGGAARDWVYVFGVLTGGTRWLLSQRKTH